MKFKFIKHNTTTNVKLVWTELKIGAEAIGWTKHIFIMKQEDFDIFKKMLQTGEKIEIVGNEIPFINGYQIV